MPATIERAAVSERLVVEVWKRQTLASDLYSAAGQRIEVVYPGRQCWSCGPDFRDALIAIDGELRHGDVEVHVRAGDWQSHGHHRDPAYDAVILHVVLWHDNTRFVSTSSGEEIPVLGLEPHLAVNVEDMPLYFATIPHLPFHCAETRQPHQITAAIDAAGDERLRARAATFEAEMTQLEPDEVLYRAVMVALGYSRNTAAFGELAELVPLSIVEAVAASAKVEARSSILQALLLGRARLLPSQRSTECGLPASPADQLFEARFEARWRDLAARWADGCEMKQTWRFARVRPDNFPTRRIVAAAQLLSTAVEAGLIEYCLDPIRRSDPDHVPQMLEGQLTVVSQERYWQDHCDFGKARAATGLHLIGQARAAEIAVNAILPFAFAYGQLTDDRDLSSRAIAVFGRYPATADNEITRYMASLILGANGAFLLRSAARQQGLLAIYKTWCLYKRCGDCPLST